jgi:predicted nuclease of restriction endonuclease-like (RecB) superfamily
MARLYRIVAIPHSEIFSTASIKSPAHFPLSWSHYVRLLSVDRDEARIYYEREALRGGWTVRMLDRQIATNAFERLKGKPSNAQGLIPNEHPDEYIRDPFVLEFLNLKDDYSELDLENALIRELESCLLELGNDFAFIARQKRLRIGTEWYKVDLVLFHRRLRCLLIVELLCGRPHNSSSVAQPVMWRSARRSAIFAPFQCSNAT